MCYVNSDWTPIQNALRAAGLIDGISLVIIDDPSLKTHGMIGVIRIAKHNNWDIWVDFSKDANHKNIVKYDRNRLLNKTIRKPTQHEMESRKVGKNANDIDYVNDKPRSIDKGFDLFKAARQRLIEYINEVTSTDPKKNHSTVILFSGAEYLSQFYEKDPTTSAMIPVGITKDDYSKAVNVAMKRDHVEYFVGTTEELVDKILKKVCVVVALDNFFVCSYLINSDPYMPLNTRFVVMEAQ